MTHNFFIEPRVIRPIDKKNFGGWGSASETNPGVPYDSEASGSRAVA